MAQKIRCGDNPDTELDGYRLLDGDPVLKIGKEYFRFTIGSQPEEQTPIYILAAKLVDAIVQYKKANKNLEV